MNIIHSKTVKFINAITSRDKGRTTQHKQAKYPNIR